MMRALSPESVGRGAARERQLKMKHRQTIFTGRIGCIRNECAEKSKTLYRRVRQGRTRRALRKGFASPYFGGSGFILSSMLTVSRIVLPVISRLFGLSLSTVSCGVCQKTLL